MTDWVHVRSLWESGESPYSIARRPGMPSKEGIRKRAKRENWERRTLPKVAHTLSINSPMLTDDLLNTVLGLIAAGSTQAIAAQAAGISARTWETWCSKDERLRDAVRRARAGKLAEWIARVDSASERDWRAGQWLLSTAPETRDQYGKSGQDSKLEIVINIDRGSGTVIDQ